MYEVFLQIEQTKESSSLNYYAPTMQPRCISERKQFIIFILVYLAK